MEKLRIGEMAKRNGVTEQALRHYDKLGIMKPCEIDKITGYRYYSPKQSIQLDIIRYLKSLGLSLTEIKNQLDTDNVEYMKVILSQQLEAIDKQIQDLMNQKVKISHALDSYSHYENFPPVGTMVFEHIPDRYMLPMPISENIYARDDDYYNDCVRELGRLLDKADIPFIEFCNVGSIIPMDKFMEGRLESYEVFTFVDPFYADHPGVRILPQTTYLCIYSNDISLEPEYVDKLRRELERIGIEPAGDYLSEDMVNLPFVNENKRTMFIRLQIPVKFPRTTT